MKNPLHQIQREAADQIRLFGRELGLTPRRYRPSPTCGRSSRPDGGAPRFPAEAGMTTKARPSAPAWRSRIVGSGDGGSTQLLANPGNWRLHGPRQRDALRGALDTVGWVQQVIVNRRTGHVVGRPRPDRGGARPRRADRAGHVRRPRRGRGARSSSPPSTRSGAWRPTSERLADSCARLSRRLCDRAFLETSPGGRAPKAGLTDPDEVPPVPADEETYVRPGDRLRSATTSSSAATRRTPTTSRASSTVRRPRFLSSTRPTGSASIPPGETPSTTPWGRPSPYMRTDGHAEGDRAPGAPGRAHGRSVGHRNTTIQRRHPGGLVARRSTWCPASRSRTSGAPTGA